MSEASAAMDLADPPNGVAVSLAPVWMLALGAGIGVANVYYVQPILPLVQRTFGATTEQVGYVPAITQAGYALGMLFLAPLGDLVDRRRLILAKSAVLVAALMASAVAPGLAAFLVASVLVGVLGSLGQDFIPLAAHLAPDARRGRTVGLVTTGLLTGILLSRSVSGVVADVAGWRSVYWMAAALVTVIAAAVWRLPALPPHSRHAGYGAILRSLVTLVRTHPGLRKAAVTQGLLAAGLGAFWSTLALMLVGPHYHLGAGAAGAFGLAGAAGAMGASLVGSLTDRVSPNAIVRLGCVAVVVAFGGMLAWQDSVPVLIVGAVVFDLGVVTGLVAHQAIVNAIDPSARSRLNGLLMTAAMAGVALGATAGGWAWSNNGWSGVCGVGLVAGALALLRTILR